MKRTIIHIDADKCNGCSLCVSACHEGAIGMVDGKAKLLRDDHCDGLGDCLPACPTGAITFEEREALAYDAQSVKEKLEKQAKQAQATPKESEPLACGCPGTHSRVLHRPAETVSTKAQLAQQPPSSHLAQWPVQLQLVPTNAPYFQGAQLLIAADCAAYAHGNFHDGFMKGKVTIIACPKLDDAPYVEKLTQIFRNNDIASVSVVRMEVPCCGGLLQMVKAALEASGKMIPWRVTILGTQGDVVSQT